MPEQEMDEEQLKALQEKIKQMSPEELKEFQKKQCIFCQIVSGKIQSRKIFEDNKSIGILDINPANPGHILLLPKEHYSIMPQIPEDEIAHIFMVSKALSNAILRALEAQGTNIIVANGIAAGQRAQHFMVHIIPRKDKDNLKFELPQKTIQEDVLEEIRKKLAGNLSGKTEEGKMEMPVALPISPIQKMQAAPAQKIVEAEFKEPKREEIKTKKFEEEKAIKKPAKVKGKKEAKEQSDINLDDIAKILGAK